MIVNLMSDTVTRPTSAMKEAMLRAEVGDDVFRQDPTINKLETYAADLFGKEAALFCPSGTMTNQIAIKCHTQPLDQVICDETSHVYQYETGGYAFHSGVSMKLLSGQHGKITAEQVEAAIELDYDWLPVSRLVVIENTCNKGGGSIYTLDEIQPIAELCREKDLAFHLDGARLFNALVETKENPRDWGASFDSISICLSKGLGAPVGSLLLGTTALIKQARRLRKVMGGGMRQAGYLAAAGLYALENNVDRLAIDNARARQIGALLEQQDYVAAVRPVQSNIVIFDLAGEQTAADFLADMEKLGVMAPAFGPQTVRFTFHLDISDEMMARLQEMLQSYSSAG
ncbi:MAG: GntG family PLP-dependent aldolase [Bacteroidota bacterium]